MKSPCDRYVTLIVSGEGPGVNTYLEEMHKGSSLFASPNPSQALVLPPACSGVNEVLLESPVLLRIGHQEAVPSTVLTELLSPPVGTTELIN